MLEENELDIFEKYPPRRLCDEYKSCADDCDIHARDMHCEDCDWYWELVESEKKEINLQLRQKPLI